jgi:hypothetical protein
MFDLSRYAGKGVNGIEYFEPSAEGSIKYVSDAVRGYKPVKYQVTSDTNPLVMKRGDTDNNGTCFWNNTYTFTLSFLSDQHVKGTWEAVFSPNFYKCESCFEKFTVEMKKGEFASIDDAPF